MSSTPVRISNPSSIHKPLGYSHVAQVTAGKLIYIAGQVAQDVSGALVGKDDFRAQLQQIFSNLNAALESAGASFTDVVKLNYFCCERVPASDLPIVREIRDRFVNTSSPPISTFVFVSRLVRAEWLIEIEAVAAVSENTSSR